MPLTGFNGTRVRPRGGVAGVELTPAPLWAGGSASSASAWAFREDRARYSEKVTDQGLRVPLVEHTLVMELPATPESRRAVASLVARSEGEGFVARVTMASGEVLAVGYSERFGTLYPLRVAGAESASGCTPGDFPTLTLTLESRDADPAAPCPQR